jgi:hypothetical protein
MRGPRLAFEAGRGLFAQEDTMDIYKKITKLPSFDHVKNQTLRSWLTYPIMIPSKETIIKEAGEAEKALDLAVASGEIGPEYLQQKEEILRKIFLSITVGNFDVAYTRLRDFYLM